MNIPANTNFRPVNAGDDAAISICDSEYAWEDVVFIDLTVENGGYQWYINGEDEEGTWELPEDGPRNFGTLAEAITDAIAYIKGLPGEEVWNSKVPQIEAFLKANQPG